MKYQWVKTYGHDPRLPAGTMVNVKFTESLHNVVSVLAESVAWSMAIAYQRIDVPAVQRDPYEHIAELQRWHNEACAERDALDAECKGLAESLNMVVAERDGYKSALNLQRLFLASAEVREARAQYNDASCKLNRAELLEQIATAISRGHLPDNFHSKLREWSK